jgi:hypothetical protein
MNRPTFGRLLQALRGIDIGHIVPGLVEPYMEEVDRDLGTFEPMLALTPRFANQMLGDVINTNSPLDIVTLALVAIREVRCPRHIPPGMDPDLNTGVDCPDNSLSMLRL